MSLRPHKGERVPTLDGGPTRGGMDLQVNPVLLANPLHRPWRKKFGFGTDSQPRERAAISGKPTIKCARAHTRRICQFIFVCWFHIYKGTNFLAARNIWIISLYSVKFFHIHSVSFNAPWKGCNFAVQLRQRSLSAERKLAISPCNELRSKTALREQAAPRQIWKLALICTRLALSLYCQSGWHTRQSQSSH